MAEEQEMQDAKMTSEPETNNGASTGAPNGDSNGAPNGESNGAAGNADGQPAQPEKKKRGKPKDPMAPPKPRNPYGQFATMERQRIKDTNPALAADLAGLGKAIAEAWGQVSQEEKEKLEAVYNKEMEVWRPLWAEYKQTQHYKEFVEIKTDWLDARARKKLQKVMTKDAPKRPRSGYMIFGGEIREHVMEKVKAEGLGLAAAGTMISERWSALSEAEKARYGEMSAQQKAKFDVEFAEYRKTDSFKTYMESKAKLEAKQGLKKIQRTCLDEAPKKAPSAFALYRLEAMPQITEENAKARAAGGETLDMAGIARKVAGMYKELDADKRKPYEEKAVQLKKKYDEDLLAFKTHQKYMKFLEHRSSIKQKENKLLRLRELPKRPKSVFAMFAAENKDKVEPGKGEGKGRDALKTLWNDLPAEQKAEYQSKEAELVDQWKKDVVEYKEGPVFKTYREVEAKVKREFANEAIKVTTMKFLREAPQPSPKSGFALFLMEKRKRQAQDDPDAEPKTKQQKRDEVQKAMEEWRKFDNNMKSEYEARKLEAFRQYEQQCRDYMSTDRWQEYVREAKRLRIPVKSLLFHKKKIIKKIDGKIVPSSIPVPRKPDTWPEKPKTAMQIFTAEMRGSVDTLEEIAKKWTELEDKSQYTQAAVESRQQFDKSMFEFKNSAEGRAYFRDLKAALRRRRVVAAKNRYLDDMPKPPVNIIKAFQLEKLPEVKQANIGKKGFELKKILDDMWKGLDDEERKKYQDLARERQNKFQEDMKAFKASDNYKRYVMATRVKKPMKGKAKAKGKGKGKAFSVPPPKQPESYPKNPLNAFQMFCRDGPGAGMKLGEAAKLWTEYDKEKKEELDREAKEAAAKYQEDFAAFKNSDAGKKYLRAKYAWEVKKKLAEAKGRFLKDQPKKPPSAYFIFAADKREWLSENHPEIRGLADVSSKITAMWKDITDEEREKYKEQETQKAEEYAKAMEDFKKSPNFRRYEAVVRKCSSRPSAKAKGKAQVALKGPPPPENMPKKPPTGIILFSTEQRGSGTTGLKAISEAWTKLGAEGQKKYMEEAKELQEKYEIDMKNFQRTAEGKKYIREQAAFIRRSRLNKAKEKYLGKEGAPKEPKRPPSAYFLFVAEKRSTLSGMSAGQVAKELTTLWNKLDADEKKSYEDKASELKTTYEEELAAYKSSSAFKMFQRASDTITGKAAQAAKARAKAKAVAAAAKAAAGRGRGGAGAGRGRGAAKAKAADSDSDSDVMGSDSDDDSSSDSDSD